MMRAEIDGWAWLEPQEADGREITHTREDGEDAIVMAFVRCFHTVDGQRVLRHLRRLTLDRTVGPATSNKGLRYLEGQRALVAHIVSLVARGSDNQ